MKIKMDQAEDSEAEDSWVIKPQVSPRNRTSPIPLLNTKSAHGHHTGAAEQLGAIAWIAATATGNMIKETSAGVFGHCHPRVLCQVLLFFSACERTAKPGLQESHSRLSALVMTLNQN